MENKKLNKNKTVRLTESDLTSLDVIAVNEGVRVSDLIRGAVTFLLVNTGFRNEVVNNIKEAARLNNSKIG